jgi:hypothetical protein
MQRLMSLQSLLSLAKSRYQHIQTKKKVSFERVEDARQKKMSGEDGGHKKCGVKIPYSPFSYHSSSPDIFTVRFHTIHLRPTFVTEHFGTKV